MADNLSRLIEEMGGATGKLGKMAGNLKRLSASEGNSEVLKSAIEAEKGYQMAFSALQTAFKAVKKGKADGDSHQKQAGL